jgi:hypothetical protein
LRGIRSETGTQKRELIIVWAKLLRSCIEAAGRMDVSKGELGN